jgi:hypothetical protein
MNYDHDRARLVREMIAAFGRWKAPNGKARKARHVERANQDAYERAKAALAAYDAAKGATA